MLQSGIGLSVSVDFTLPPLLTVSVLHWVPLLMMYRYGQCYAYFSQPYVMNHQNVTVTRQ